MSDASRVGYGQCSYLGLVDENNKIYCCFVMGKSRVPPMEIVGIPRLELAVATVSLRAANMLKEELDLEELETYYWKDSKVFLAPNMDQEG